MIGSMEVPREDTIRRRKQDEVELKEAEKHKRKNSQGREMSPPCVLSLDDEFKQLTGGDEEEGEEDERVVNEETLLEDLIEEGSEGDRSSESGEESTTEGEEKGEDDEGENWRNIEEELKLQEDMMAVKMEVEMMQKEKEGWEKEKKNLELDKIEARSQRETLEE
jgi:hypothetical protein